MVHKVKVIKTNHELSKATKSAILKSVIDNKGISRIEISNLTGISNPTVTRIVDILINENGLLEERGNKNTPKGRPMKSLYFKGDNKFIIGIDLGTTYIRGILTNLNTEIIKEVEVVTEVEKGVNFVLQKVTDVIERLYNTNLIDNTKIKGIGLAVAGIVNTNTGIVEYSPAFNWRNVKFRQFFAHKFSIPVLFDNVSRTMAIGELYYGYGKDYSSFICVNVGYGIGAGIVVDRQLFYGTDGMAGELGHLPVIGDGLIECSCGKNNCLTCYSSGDAIAERAKLRIRKGEKTILNEMVVNNIEDLDAKIVAEACGKNDPVACEIINQATYYLGTSIAGLMNIFNPEAIILGGGVTLNGDIFWKPLRKAIDENVFDKRSTKYKILHVRHPNKTALYGSIALIMERIISFQI